MSEDVRRLIDEAVAELESTQADVALLSNLAEIANTGTSTEEIGSFLLTYFDGDYELTKTYLDTLSKRLTLILYSWALGARITYLTTKKEER